MKSIFTKDNVKRLFARVLNKQSLVFLFFVVLSTCFWLFQNLSGTYEMEFEVPVKLANVPDKVVVTNPPQSSLNVTLKDHGLVLLQYKYFTKFSPLVIDFSQHAGRDGAVSIATRDLVKQLDKQLASNTKVSSYRPETVDYFYNYGEYKKIPVRLQGHIITSGQIRVSAVSLKPESVSVYAVSGVLDTITAAYTSKLNMPLLRRDTDFVLPLRGVRGAKFIPNQINAKVLVDMITEKSVQVPIEMVNFPATKVLRTFPQKVKVTFQVGASKYNSITADNFVIVVSYDELVGNTTGKFAPKLKTLPVGTSHVRISPSEVEFIIEDIPSQG